MITRILVTGASGLLGSRVVELGAKYGYEMYSSFNEHTLTYENVHRIDLKNEDEVNNTISWIKPHHIIHCAALSDVDRCEKEKDLAWRINVEGTRYIIKAAEKIGSSVVYVSTDYVFNGTRGKYKEEDEVNPINYYGYTKFQAELLVRSMAGVWVIVRPSVIYGSVPCAGKVNFVLWLVNKLRGKESVNIITDQWVSPTLNTSLAEMILEIIEKRSSGVFNLAGATRISRYDFAIAIARKFDLDETLISPVSSKNMNWAAKRPRDSSLDVSKACANLQKKPIEIDEALRILDEELASSAVKA